MAINLDNAQYGKFVQFAEQQIQAGNEKAIARDGGALAGHTIVAATGGDKVAPFWRSQADKDANNAARDLFRQAIADMFGGEAAIPRSVSEAMNLGDFDQGKPLTARRIIAVKAEVDRIVSVHTAFNNGVAENLLNGHLERLPQDLRDGLAQLVNDLRAVFGADAVPPNAVIRKVLHPEHIRGEIDALRKAANAQGRDLTSAEVLGLYVGKAFDRLASTTAGAFILAKAKAREPNIAFTSLSMGSQFEARHPGLLAEIRLCKNPGDIAIVLQNHEAEINAFVDVAVRSNAACKVVESKARAKLTAALGLDARLVASHASTDKLREDAKVLTSAILLGEAPGCREPGYNVEAAYDALVDEFVQKRAEAYAAIESLDLPEDVKNRWKADCIANRDMPLLTPAQLFEVARSIDVRKLEGAFSKGMPTKLAVEVLNNVTKTIIADIDRVTGRQHFLTNAGVDDMTLLFGMLIAAAKAKSPAFAQALQNAGNAFFDAADAYCETSASLSDVTIFVKTLSIRGGTANEVPVTNKESFLAIVEADAEAALAECGVTDAKVRKDVKDAMLQRGRTAFAGATGLKGLSDFLAAAKAEATALAQALNGIAKSRSGALSVAATVISVSSGISKAYVMNNLGMNAITSDSGKLRFLYDEVLAKARNGEGVDLNGSLNKANEIIAKFARGKAEILKAIDEAGFDPAARAAHRLAALRDPGWTDPDVAKVAQGLAGDKALKDTTGRAVIAKYADGLTQETVPLLAKLVGVLDWRGKASAASEEIVKKFVEDMKAWRDVVPGSSDANGLEGVFQRRMNGYLKDVLAGNTNASFNTGNYPGLFQTFLDDLPRCTYVINGKKVLGATLQEKIGPYMEAIKDPAKRKVVSVMINQQLYGDYTASVSNRIPFAGWKNGMPDEPVDTIPEIRKFASRDIAKTILQVFDTGPLEFAIDISPDESTVTVHAKIAYPIHADFTLPTTMIGTCTVSQEFVIDFTGAEPVIRDFKIGQALE